MHSPERDMILDSAAQSYAGLDFSARKWVAETRINSLLPSEFHVQGHHSSICRSLHISVNWINNKRQDWPVISKKWSSIYRLVNQGCLTSTAARNVLTVFDEYITSMLYR